VQMWLNTGYKSTDFLEKEKQGILGAIGLGGGNTRALPSPVPTYSSASQLAGDDDTYYDEDEEALKWRVSPKHFVVEDDNCGIHLIKNALGGNRRELFNGIMTVTPPLSRNVRDDITVQVIFFGVDTQGMIKN